jgi:hypothetical protein
MQEYVSLPFGDHMGFLIGALDGDPSVVTGLRYHHCQLEWTRRWFETPSHFCAEPACPSNPARSGLMAVCLSTASSNTTINIKRSPARRCAYGVTLAGAAWSGKASITTASSPTTWLGHA